MAIIKSFLDQDLYKFTMGQAVLHRFPDSHVKIKFHCRSDVLLGKYIDEVNKELDSLCNLSCTADELEYLSTRDFFKKDFIEFLRIFRLNRNFINTSVDSDGQLQIIAEGPWLHVIWFEVFVLAIVEEIYTRNEFADNDMKEGKKKLEEKIKKFNAFGKKLPYKFADFGTRRRYSYDWHRYVVSELSKNVSSRFFVGTSNVLFAKEFGISPIGTMAHEWLQAGMALGPRLKDSQKFMLDEWVREYRGDLGIALSDVVGFDAFLRDFDKFFAKLYDGCRHDSGDPIEWGEKLIDHYISLGIAPHTKTAVFSDGLDPDYSFKIANHFRGRLNTSFGIGTNLTNDVGIKPLQLVMKMVECNGSPVAKISDSPGKGMCESEQFENYLKSVFEIPVHKKEK